jgi:hypothetical protein
MTDNALAIDKETREVVWRVAQTLPDQRLQTPWGDLCRGSDLDAGPEVWVEAREAFDLTMIYGPTSYFEAIVPGRHRFILTVLDSTDVA